MADLLPYVLAAAAGLLALLLAPAVDRWVERFDEWMSTSIPPSTSICRSQARKPPT